MPRGIPRKPNLPDRMARLTPAEIRDWALALGMIAWDMSERQDIRRALEQQGRTARNHRISASHIPWEYETFGQSARLALQLYATGLFTMHDAVKHTHLLVSPTAAATEARRLLRLVREEHPAAQRAMEEGYVQMKTPLEALADAKVDAATEAMSVLRDALRDPEVPVETRLKVAQDFLDRLPDTSKVSRNEVKQTGGSGVMLPPEAAQRLMESAARATRYLMRSPDEIAAAARGTDLHDVPEAEKVSLVEDADA